MPVEFLTELAAIGVLCRFDPLHVVGLNAVLIKQETANPGIGAESIPGGAYYSAV